MTFRVGVTRDFLKPDGTLGYGDIGLGLLDETPGVEWEFLAEDTASCAPIRCAATTRCWCWLPASPPPRWRRPTGWRSWRASASATTASTSACTRNVAPDDHAGRRAPAGRGRRSDAPAGAQPQAAGEGPPDPRRPLGGEARPHGPWVTGRTLGIIGLGNIGRERLALARPFEMRSLAFDPYLTPSGAAVGVELVDLETLLRESDFVSISCALTPETHHLLDAERLALMKPTAYLINTARGPIVDQRALTRRSRDGRIAGAGLDVFEQEPVDPADPILTLDNVIVAPARHLLDGRVLPGHRPQRLREHPRRRRRPRAPLTWSTARCSDPRLYARSCAALGARRDGRR